MMIVMKDAVRLPGLPPVSLEVDPGVVNDAVVVNVGEQDAHVEPVHGTKEDWSEEPQLHVHEFHWMDGRHGESRRLLVCVVQLVEVFVEEGRVVQPVKPVCHVILVNEN